MKYLDTHCHVDLSTNRSYTIDQINQQEIYTVAVSNLPSLFEKNKVIVPESKYIKHALGYHPELVGQFPNEMEKFSIQIKKTRFLGEIGIDGSYKYKDSLNKQIEIFEQILNLAERESGKILTIHSRKAEKKVVEILKGYNQSKKILHWFQGDKETLMKAIALDCYFSFNKKMLLSKKGKIVLQSVPLSRILLESDFPFATNSNINQSRDYFSSLLEICSTYLSIDKNTFENVIETNQKSLLKDH